MVLGFHYQLQQEDDQSDALPKSTWQKRVCQLFGLANFGIQQADPSPNFFTVTSLTILWYSVAPTPIWKGMSDIYLFSNWPGRFHRQSTGPERGDKCPAASDFVGI